MKTIDLEEFMKLVEADEALAARLRDCPDARSAMQALTDMAAELGYELKSAAPGEKEALADDDLDLVTGGINPFVPRGEGELNPYSWFVSLMRRLMKKDEEQQPTGIPERRVPNEIDR